MMRSIAIAAALALAAFGTAPAAAGWKLVEHAKPVKVAKGKLTVTPGEDWNRNGSRVVKKSETWTLDGEALNEIYFISGLAPGETLFKDIDKKENPLPVLGSSVLLTDIPDFYESSTRIARQTSLFEMGMIEPATLAGEPAIRFTFTYGTQGSPVIRKGVATAAIVNGQLHLISYIAPTIHYFDRDAAKAEAIVASAELS